MPGSPAIAAARSARVVVAQPGDEGQWNEFLTRHPQATVAHLFGWSAVAERAYGKTSYPLYTARGERWGGVFPLVHMRGRLAGNRLVSMPYLDQGGILAHSAKDARTLLAGALELAAELGARGIESRGATLRGATGAPGVQRFRWLLSLDGSLEDLWRRLGGKVRNQIRKSDKLGLTTHREGAEELSSFYAIFARNMRDVGSPTHALAFFQEICAVFGPRVSLYLTRQPDGRPVAGAIALHFRDTVVVPWASSLRAARPACPNHSLYWRILRDAAGQGASVFDFGRSPRGSGTERFKRQWGPRPVALDWSYLDLRGRNHPENVAERGYARHLVYLWRHLPLAVANRLGPTIRGRLPL